MKIEQLIEENNWKDLEANFDVKDIAKSLPFLTGIKLAYSLLYNKEWDEETQEFALHILEAIRSTHLKEWNSSWQYDGFLGLAYDICLKYDERYEALRRALEKTKNPPPQLLIALARCCECPGKPPISYEEAIAYLTLALKDYLYVDGVGLMRKIYWFKDDIKNEQYWADILKRIENHNIESPSLDSVIAKSL